MPKAKNHHRFYSTARWKRERNRQFVREPRCRMCLALGKQTAADTVDHIIPHCGDYDLFWDRSNYQSLCSKCHNTKTYYETMRTRKLPGWIKPKSDDIILLFGAPASGKTTWALQQQDRKVVDLDLIKEKVTGGNPYSMDKKFLSMCLAIRNQMIAQSTQPLIVVATLPERELREDWLKKLNAKPALMTTPMHECIQRANNDPRRENKQKQIGLIKAWFKKYQPSGNERFIPYE